MLQMVCIWEKEVSILQGNRTSSVESFKGCMLFSDGVIFFFISFLMRDWSKPSTSLYGPRCFDLFGDNNTQ